MLEFSVLVFTYFTEALIVYLYAKSIYEAKTKNAYSFIFTMFMYSVLFVIYKYIINAEMLNAVLVIIANILIFKLVFLSSLKSSVFHSIILCIVQIVSEFIATYLVALTLHASSETIVDDHFGISVTISRVIYFLFTQIITKVSLRENSSKSWGRWVMLSVLPISSIIVVLVIRILTNTISLSTYQNIICIVTICILFIVNVIIYIIYEQAEKSSQKLIELELSSQKNEIDLQYLNLLEKKNEDMQIMAHDYKDHIQAMQSMERIADIHKYLNELKGEIENTNKIAKTRNSIIDVILSKYIDICKEKHIDFNISSITDNLEFLAINDASALFNNLLDNAVEAAQSSNEKYINLQISNSLGAYHKIVLVNSSDISPVTSNGKLLTSKKNKQIHGFGTKSIEKIVDKYQGELQWNYYDDKKEFEVVIVIPISKHI